MASTRLAATGHQCRGHKINYNYVHDSIGFGGMARNGRRPTMRGAFTWMTPAAVARSRQHRGALTARQRHDPQGRNNRIENNILIEGGLQQIELRGWEAKYSYWQSLLPTMDKRYQETKDHPAWKAIGLCTTA